MTDNIIRDRVYNAAAASLFLYASSTIFLPVCLVKISQDLGFSLTQGGALGFVSSIEVFLVLLFSGFAAGRFGKIRILRASMVILALGLFIFPRSTSFGLALILILVMGIANGFFEALLTPLVEDLYPGDGGKKMNLLHSFWSIGIFCTVILLGELLSRGISWQIQYRIFSLLVLAGALVYPSPKSINLPQSRTDFSHMGEILSLSRFWVLGFALFFSGGAEGAFTFWSASYIQLHFDTLPRAGAFGTASFAAGMAVGRMISSRLSQKWGLKNLIAASLTAGLLISGTFFLISSIITLYIFLLVMGLSIACLWPSIQSYGGRVMRVDNTLLMIFLSCFGIPGFSSVTFLMGITGDRWGLQKSFAFAPLYLFLALSMILLESRARGHLKEGAHHA